MGISTTAAIIGSAVIGGGAALASGAMASDAAQNASDAQTASNAQALALQKQEFDTTQSEYAPWRTVGAGALQMLARTENINVPSDTFSYYGLTPANSNTATGGAAASGTGAASQAGQPDWDAYLKANPDVAAWAQSGHGDPNTPIDQQTLEQRAAYQYHNSGQSEGRQLPTIAASPATTAAPGSVTTAATAGPQAYDANGLPITNTVGKPTGVTTAPTSTTPAGANPQYGDFYASPDYQFRLNQGETAITGNMAAKGLLDSGALGKGLINYGQQAASQEFGNWYNRIASLAGVGQTAVAGSTAAGQANTNAQTGIIQNTGQSQASSIATQGGINSGLISSLGGTASGLINNLKTSTPANSNTSAINLGGGADDAYAAASGGGGGGLYGPVI